MNVKKIHVKMEQLAKTNRVITAASVGLVGLEKSVKKPAAPMDYKRIIEALEIQLKQGKSVRDGTNKHLMDTAIHQKVNPILVWSRTIVEIQTMSLMVLGATQ